MKRSSALLWRPRISKKRRAKVTKLIQRTCPTARDRGDALEVTLDEGSFRDVWLFLLVREFSGIEPGKGAAK